MNTRDGPAHDGGGCLKWNDKGMNEWTQTFLNLRINVEGLASWVDGAVPVELLTHGQRGVFSVRHLVRQVAYSQVLETDVLKNQKIESV